VKSITIAVGNCATPSIREGLRTLSKAVVIRRNNLSDLGGVRKEKGRRKGGKEDEEVDRKDMM
jgi:hypothetical protein